jgi:hypothetical protein
LLLSNSSKPGWELPERLTPPEASAIRACAICAPSTDSEVPLPPSW